MDPTLPDGFILLAHGSPAPGWADPLHALCRRVTNRTGRPAEPALLRHGPPHVEDAARNLRAKGVRAIQVVPVFLSNAGGHMDRDVPAAVARLGSLHPELRVTLRPGALAADPRVLDAMAAVLAEAP